MRTNNTTARTLHDIGLAGWFGSVLMGAISVNRAVGVLDDPHQTGRVTNAVWRRWLPANAALIVAHVIGGIGITADNKSRIVAQRGVFGSSVIKSTLTVAALGATAWSGWVGRQIDAAGDVALRDGTTAVDQTPTAVATWLRHQNVLQWVVSALTGGLIVVAAFQGEQQRTTNVVAGTIDRLLPGR